MGFVANLFKKPKVAKPLPPPSPPTKADATVLTADRGVNAGGFSSLINTGATGLKRKAKTQKATLIGG